MIMTTIITITLLVVAAISSLAAITHEDSKRGRNAAIIMGLSTTAIIVLTVFGG